MITIKKQNMNKIRSCIQGFAIRQHPHHWIVGFYIFFHGYITLQWAIGDNGTLINTGIGFLCNAIVLGFMITCEVSVRKLFDDGIFIIFSITLTTVMTFLTMILITVFPPLSTKIEKYFAFLWLWSSMMSAMMFLACTWLGLNPILLLRKRYLHINLLKELSPFLIPGTVWIEGKGIMFEKNTPAHQQLMSMQAVEQHKLPIIIPPSMKMYPECYRLLAQREKEKVMLVYGILNENTNTFIPENVLLRIRI